VTSSDEYKFRANNPDEDKRLQRKKKDVDRSTQSQEGENRRQKDTDAFCASKGGGCELELAAALQQGPEDD
jgi:hypothetical protein